MVSFEVVSDEPLAEADVDLLVVGAARGGTEDDEDAPPVPGAAAQRLAEAIEVDLATELEGLAFDGGIGATARIPTRGLVPAPMVLVVGLGAVDELTPTRLRTAAAAVADASERLASLATSLAVDAEPGVGAGTAVAAVAEGIGLAAYRFDGLKTDVTPHHLEQVRLHVPEDAADPGRAESALAAAEHGIDAVGLARDLVNLPSGRKRPPELAERAAREVADLPVEVRVLDAGELEDGGYGGLLGVAAGSKAPPRLVELRYRPEDAETHVALVGKGITFDSGGLSLKPSKSMERMKVDMAGAAAMLAVVRAAAARGLPVAVTALLALAENMPGGAATRPGDVLTTRDGTTVEVLNTDAEGRLVLADALAHASELEPDVIVDAATLTGAAVVALGPDIGALMSTDDELAEALAGAAEAAGEPLWRLPVATEQYGDDLEGDVGDVKNSGWKGAGTIRAGLFLHEFVADGIPWAHLDIAGVAWAQEASGVLRKGGTGAPVRTLLAWLADGTGTSGADPDA